MELRITKNELGKDILQIDNARIIWTNFAGLPGKFNREGERDFTLVIPTEEIRDALLENTNKFGAGWNVKTKPPRDEDEAPFMTLKVRVKFTSRGPSVYLKSGNKTIRLNENTIRMLDDIDIANIDMDIRAYDDEFNGKPFRSAYLDSMHVTQSVNRFTDRYDSDFANVEPIDVDEYQLPF